MMNTMSSMIDFHSHILPCIDDGAVDIEMSVQMLKMAQTQGVGTIMATPHCYLDKVDVDTFIKNRDAAYGKIKKKIDEYNANNKNGPLPYIRLGAEVYMIRNLPQCEGLERLCIKGTSCILIEMPFEPWQRWMFDNLFEIIAKHSLVPVIAHLEQYAKSVKEAKIKFETLFGLDVFIQIDNDALLDFRKRRIVDWMVAEGAVHVIGSDAHNTSRRKPNMDMAKKIITKRYGEQYFDELMKVSQKLISGEFQ